MSISDVLGAALPGVVTSTRTSTRAYRLMLSHGDVCAYCKGTGGILDHVTPKCRLTQTEGPRNYTAASPACNHAKADQSLLAYLLAAADERMVA